LWLERCGHSSTPSNRSWDPLPQRHGFTLNGLGATALRAGAASHHACGREELPRCWADSETRPQGPALVKDGKAGPRAVISRPGQPRRQPDASRPTVSAVSSLKWARAHETGSRPSRGRTPASDRWLNQVGHLHPAGRSTVHGAPPLSASQAGFGLLAGRPRTRPGPRQPLLRIYHGGRRLGWEPLGHSTDSAGLPGSP
jgi:hypothetical protein